MMRHFGSYGPLDTEEHFYVPREALIDKAYHQLLGLNQKKSGHYITVWAPRQSGKSWLLREVLYRLKHFQNNAFDVLKLNLEDQKDKTNVPDILQSIAGKIGEDLGKKFTGINDQQKFQDIFKKGALDKPLILILDEFDALEESAINTVVSAFRNIYINRLDQKDKITHEKKYLLHGVALIGVRSVLGIENIKGSPFNVQRSLHVPNLSHDEVTELFRWYEKESGQKVEQEVIDRLYYETMGQPGLTCWFGELLTEGFEGYVPDKTLPVTMKEFEIVYAAAAYVLPNNNILNILSKVSQEKEKEFVLEMFRTDKKIEFRYDDKVINSLYMNGVAGKEVEDRTRYYLRFSCPFVQKRVFSYFSNEIFKRMGTLV
ncbi:MAG: AAA family ATPase, partial [bacterium]|nr:AAA family ATPase [bacterium]